MPLLFHCQKILLMLLMLFDDSTGVGGVCVLGAMAVERLQALGTFLEQCRNETNFDTLREQQFNVMRGSFNDMHSVTFEEGVALVSTLQSQLWNEEQRRALIGIIQEKTVAHAQTAPVGGRRMQQDFLNLPLFLREEDWARLRNPLLQSQALCGHLRLLAEHLFKLTLRNPTESTYSMLTILLLLNDEQRRNDPLMLRSAYLSTKTQMKTYLEQLKKDDQNTLPLLLRLPGSVDALGNEYRAQAFGENQSPATLPAGIQMDQLLMWARIVPERSNHHSLQPKALNQRPSAQYIQQPQVFQQPLANGGLFTNECFWFLACKLDQRQ